MIREADVSDEAFILLIGTRHKAGFLFDQDIVDHMEKVLDVAKELRLIKVNLYGKKALPVGQERDKLAQRKSDLLEWNLEQMKSSPKRYSRYLKFR